jgi:sister-chromatid-cohesion protein PDS5
MDEFNNITYPNKVRPVNENLPFEELFRRLQQLSAALQNLTQEEDQKYTALALHLTDDFFLNHPAKDIQLLVACCLADILRIFAPEPPYKDQRVIKVDPSII